MHTKSTLVLLAAALTFSPLAVRAQTNTLPPGGFTGGGFPDGGSQGGFGGGGFGGGGFQDGGQGITAKPAWMSNRVSLSVKNAFVHEALFQIFENAGVKDYDLFLNPSIYYQIRNGTDKDGANYNKQAYANPISLTLQPMTVEEILKRVSSAAGVVITFRTQDNKLSVLVAKTAAGYGTVYTISPKSSIDPAIADALNQAAKTTRDVQMFYTTANALTVQLNNTLPDTRVGLDVRDGDLRDTLKNVLNRRI